MATPQEQIKDWEKQDLDKMAKLKSRGKRFVAIEGSQSGHCCFEATVLDTHSETLRSENRPALHFDAICECFSIEDAEFIANKLNKTKKYDN